jgi:hypothetical protein
MVLIAFSAIGTARSPVNQGPNGVSGPEKEVSNLTHAIPVPLLNSYAGLEHYYDGESA